MFGLYELHHQVTNDNDNDNELFIQTKSNQNHDKGNIKNTRKKNYNVRAEEIALKTS